MRFLLLATIFFYNLDLFAQTGRFAIGAESAAMGGTSTTLSSVWSSNNNQAALGFYEETGAGIYYENRFLLKELSYRAAAFSLPLNTGAFGLVVTSFGYRLYNQTDVGVSYGQRLGKKFSLGGQLSYSKISLSQEYGQKGVFTGAVGLIAKLTKELVLGVHVHNPTKTSLSLPNGERVPTTMKLGIGYTFSESVFLALETEKSTSNTAMLKLGMEYQAKEILFLRGGISTGPTLSSFGFGLKFGKLRIDVSSAYHSSLGVTPALSLIYSGRKR